MDSRRTPYGGMHSRDFSTYRQQRTLGEAPVDGRGDVRFACTRCPRTGKVAMAELRARFSPQAGLVNILNALLPADCGKSKRTPGGHVECGYYYRDLGGRSDG